MHQSCAQHDIRSGFVSISIYRWRLWRVTGCMQSTWNAYLHSTLIIRCNRIIPTYDKWRTQFDYRRWSLTASIRSRNCSTVCFICSRLQFNPNLHSWQFVTFDICSMPIYANWMNTRNWLMRFRFLFVCFCVVCFNSNCTV